MAQELSADQYRAQRIANRQALTEMGYDPYGHAFARTGTLEETRTTFEEGKDVAVAGRIMTKRRMGKLMFIHLSDGTDAFQILLKRDVVGEAAYNAAKLLDLGDFIGVKGKLFVTQAGEQTVDVATWDLLSKAIRQPPDKHSGLQDVEARYRRRYLDLMSNQESRNRFNMRHKILLGIRNFLTQRGFVEVETPMMQPQAGGAAARPFYTHHNALNRELAMRIAPELYLKRLLVGGFDKIFELGKDFRNEGIDRTHNPEFTVLEVYEAYGDRTSMKNIIEGMLPYLCDTVLGTRQVAYGESKTMINFEPPYREVAQSDLIKEKMGADWFDLDYTTARDRAVEAGLKLTPEIKDMLTLSHEVYDKLIEKTLMQPTFVTRIPKQYVPLAKACKDDPTLVDVFEFVVAGRELCPGYTEQNNPDEQAKAFANQADPDAEPPDQDFVEALEYGMPPTGGLGMGIDRLVMFLTGTEAIRDVLLFPQMKDAESEE